jgi:hypothetical protein
MSIWELNGIKVNPRYNNREKTKSKSRKVVFESKGANNTCNLEVNVFLGTAKLKKKKCKLEHAAYFPSPTFTL